MEPPPLRLLLLTVALAFTLALTGSANAQRQAPRAQAPTAGPAVPAVPQPPVAQERLPAPPTPPTEVKVISTPDPDPASRPEVRSERDLDAQEGMAVAGYMVAVFAALQALLTAGGMWLLWKTLKATRAAVTEAQEATRAAQDAVIVTKDAAERQLRAYVNVSAAQSRWSPTLRALIEIKNSGQTPGYDLTHWTATGFGTSDRADFSDDPPRQASVLGAGGTQTTETPVAPGNGTIHEAFRSGSVTMFVWGRIDYRDAFGVRRMTAYRLRWVDGGDDGRLVVCDEGNSAT